MYCSSFFLTTITPLSQWRHWSHRVILSGESWSDQSDTLRSVPAPSRAPHWDFPLFPTIFEKYLPPSSSSSSRLTGSLDLWESHQVTKRSRKWVMNYSQKSNKRGCPWPITGRDIHRSLCNAAKSLCKGVMLLNQAHSVNIQSYVINALNMPF